MTIRQNPALQERIRSVLRGKPGLTSAQIAEALAEPHEVVSWEVVVLTHQRELRFEGIRPTRYRLADHHPMSIGWPAQ